MGQVYLQQLIAAEPASVLSALTNNKNLLEMESHRCTPKSQSGTILFSHCIPVATE